MDFEPCLQVHTLMLPDGAEGPISVPLCSFGYGSPLGNVMGQVPGAYILPLKTSSPGKMLKFKLLELLHYCYYSQCALCSEHIIARVLYCPAVPTRKDIYLRQETERTARWGSVRTRVPN
jgi:hypothetical protein